MKILPVQNYNIQNKQSNNAQSFKGMFVVPKKWDLMEAGMKEEEAQSLIQYCYKILKLFLKNKEFEKAIKNETGNEVGIQIGKPTYSPKTTIVSFLTANKDVEHIEYPFLFENISPKQLAKYAKEFAKKLKANSRFALKPQIAEKPKRFPKPRLVVDNTKE